MKNDWIWLSHVTSDETPAYGGGSGFKTISKKQICSGDSWFYKKQAGFSPDLFSYFLDKFESFCAIGLNAISISSFMHRHIGRLAHKQPDHFNPLLTSADTFDYYANISYRR